MLNLDVCKRCVGKGDSAACEWRLSGFVVARRQVSDDNPSYIYKIFARFVNASLGVLSRYKGCEMNYNGDIASVTKLFSRLKANPNSTFAVPKNQEEFFMVHCEPTPECQMYAEHLLINLNSRKNKNEH